MTAASSTHTFYPRGAALELMNDRSKEIILAGPAGTGKSRACLEKGNLLAMANPGSKGLIVRKTATSLSSTALVTYEEKVVAELLAAGQVNWFSGSGREAPGYRYANGSKINVGGMDKASKIMSTEYDWVFVQEATELSLDDWEKITTRMRNGMIGFDQVMADCNPDAPWHWLNERGRSGQLRMLTSTHKDNPLYWDVTTSSYTPKGTSYILGTLAKLTGVRRERLYLGLWAAAEGVIYENYDASVHLIDRFTKDLWDPTTRLCQHNIPWDWPRYWTIDFGFKHPFVLQRWCENPEGELILYAEQYMTHKNVQEHCRDLKQQLFNDRNEWKEPRPLGVYADHDAEDRDTFSKEMRIATSPADKRVKVGIDTCSERLAVADNGRAGVYFMRDSVWRKDPALSEARLPTCTVDEFPGYVWDPKKEGPVKEYDDGMDGFRYMVMERARGGFRYRYFNPNSARRRLQ